MDEDGCSNQNESGIVRKKSKNECPSKNAEESKRSNRKIKYYDLRRMEDEGERKLIDFCMEHGLIASTYVCPLCKENMTLCKTKNLNDGYEWACKGKEKINGHKRVHRSVRKGSWFSKSHLTLGKVLVLTHCWVKEIPVAWIMDELECSSHTVSDWFSFCRDVCCFYERNCMIGGENVEVEIAETVIYRKQNKGKIIKEVWVLGGVERGTGNCIFQIIKNRSQEELLRIIKEKIWPGTTIFSDCWKSYSCLQDEEFKHLIVNNLYCFKDPESGTCTNTIKGIWAVIKNNIPKHKEENFQAYLCEYIWRKKNLTAFDKFITFMEAIRLVFPPETEE